MDGVSVGKINNGCDKQTERIDLLIDDPNKMMAEMIISEEG